MIYTTINSGSQLQDEFKKFSDRGNTFTPAGYDALFDYLEESGEDIELDVIALCCDFCEYESLDAIRAEWNDASPDDGIFLETLAHRGIVIETRIGSYILSQQ
jgi:hypothetical protein